MVTRAQTQANYDRLSRWYDLLAGSSERKYCELGLRMLDVRPGRVGRHRVILPIGGVHRGSLAALAFARALSDDVTAVYVSIDPVEAEKIRNKL